ncbi:DcaP family trimeric outer membrane transporter [uncultured Muribaculum sp.]|uniref:DcaP family trimeric outer membrane transporter n=1 Tax=uncultured Muribaculum sp. TaxID=1918613 RepID=UPI00266E931E|nr:DcaP family trimeric outer membrane transporter [uncultured Muribaculum sp.]
MEISARTILVSLSFIGLYSVAAYAGDSSTTPTGPGDTSHKIVYIGNGDDMSHETQNQIINNFYYDQFRHFQDPLAPYFMLMSKDGKLAMGIGGAVSVQGFYDWGGSMPTTGFIPYNIPVSGNVYSSHRYGTSIAGTTLFARVFGHADRFGEYQLYIEGKFGGTSSNYFKLKKAYMSLNDWTLGYASSTFSDPAAQPPTVDPQGPNAEVSHTSVLLRWMHTMHKNFVAALSVETPDLQIPELENRYKGCSAYMPVFAGFIQYQWDGIDQHVRLSGIVRGLEYRNLVQAQNKKITGWGAHLSTVLKPVAPLKVYGAVNVGQGIGSLMNDLQNSPMDLIGKVYEQGQMYAPLSLGWYAGLQYNFSPKVFTTIMFGEMRFLPKHQSTDMGNDLYKYGLYGAANIFWYPTSRLALAAEYNYGYRRDFDTKHHDVNRISLLAKYSF